MLELFRQGLRVRCPPYQLADQRRVHRPEKILAHFRTRDALDVLIYIHPAVPHQDVVRAYYADYVPKYPSLLTAAWGFTVETATAGIRMVLSEVFDEYPKLQIVLGHLGEGLPFLLWRISDSLGRDSDYPFRENSATISTS